MKPHGDYHPPTGWVRFDTLNPGDTFHDIGPDGQPVQYLKVDPSGWPTTSNAVRLRDGKLYVVEDDEFVYPVDTGWVAELNCYGFQISPELAAKGHQAVLAHVMLRTEGRKVNECWRKEIEKYLPQLALMSFSGPDRVIDWLMEHVDIKSR